MQNKSILFLYDSDKRSIIHYLKLSVIFFVMMGIPTLVVIGNETSIWTYRNIVVLAKRSYEKYKLLFLEIAVKFSDGKQLDFSQL